MEPTRTYNQRRYLLSVLVLATSGSLVLLAGCEQPMMPGETYHKVSAAWPLFDLEKSEGIDDEGNKWQKEKGDAICWLINWEKERKYDKDGFLVYRKEHSEFFPISLTEVEEDKEFKTKQGRVLIFPYYSRRARTTGH